MLLAPHLVVSLTPILGSVSMSMMTRFTQPHVHMYMFCPGIISTIYHLLEELQMGTFKRYFSLAILLTTLYLREMDQDTIVVNHNYML